MRCDPFWRWERQPNRSVHQRSSAQENVLPPAVFFDGDVYFPPELTKLLKILNGSIVYPK
jgi:hypothetical protein